MIYLQWEKKKKRDKICKNDKWSTSSEPRWASNIQLPLYYILHKYLRFTLGSDHTMEERMKFSGMSSHAQKGKTDLRCGGYSESGCKVCL